MPASVEVPAPFGVRPFRAVAIGSPKSVALRRHGASITPVYGPVSERVAPPGPLAVDDPDNCRLVGCRVQKDICGPEVAVQQPRLAEPGDVVEAVTVGFDD